MALSYFSDLLPFQAYGCYPQFSFFKQNWSDTVSPDLFRSNDQSFGSLSESFVNPLIEPIDELYYSDSYTNLLPYFSSASENMVSLTPEMFPIQEYNCSPQPKRQKISCEGCHKPDPQPSLYDKHYIGAPNSVQGFLTSGIPAPEAPKVQDLTGFDVGVVENVKKPNGVTLSAQSIAARERRRKITEKTQELGKLIPGGNKMNTAEMFQAATKYVKFLQAQVGILELMNSAQEKSQEALHGQEMQALLESTKIQEKLYLEEKCLVPKEFAQDGIHLEPLFIEEIDKLL